MSDTTINISDLLNSSQEMQIKLESKLFAQIAQKLEDNNKSLEELHKNNVEMSQAITHIIATIVENETKKNEAAYKVAKLEIRAKILEELQPYKEELEEYKEHIIKIKRIGISDIIIYLLMAAMAVFLISQT